MVLEKEGPFHRIVAGLPGFAGRHLRVCGLTQSIVPAGTPLREGVSNLPGNC